MSGKALLPGFADDEEDQEDEIKSHEADITALFRECERRLKEMGRTKSEGTQDEVCARATRARAKCLAPSSLSFLLFRRVCGPLLLSLSLPCSSCRRAAQPHRARAHDPV